MPFDGWELEQRIEYILQAIDRVKDSMDGVDSGEPGYSTLQNIIYELGQILINDFTLRKDELSKEKK